MRPKNDAQIIKRLEKKIDRFEKKNAELQEEMVTRGIELSRLIQIFFVCENLLPEGPKEDFLSTALDYASRCDKDKDRRYIVLNAGKARQAGIPTINEAIAKLAGAIDNG
jgi:nitrogen fixation/metabolism regulation signal transduction histidine kinase